MRVAVLGKARFHRAALLCAMFISDTRDRNVTSREVTRVLIFHGANINNGNIASTSACKLQFTTTVQTRRTKSRDDKISFHN